MRLKTYRLVIAMFFPIFIAFSGGIAYADTSEDIVNALVAKGILTEEEGALILKGRSGQKQTKKVPEINPDEKVVTVSPDKTIHAGDVNIKLGGFVAGETVYRTKALGSDINSPYRNIPFPVSGNTATAIGANANQSEFRGTARQSRFSLLANGKINDNISVEGYSENDFLAQPATGNLNQSDSFTLRIRNLYGNVDWKDEGVHLLAGQSWSLATLNGQGIIQRKEKTPPSIDAQYLPGFTWTRQWQLRLVKDWDRKYWAAISLENPQSTNLFGLQSGTNVSTVTTVGGSLLSGTPTISTNKYPDIILKVATDNALGHFELFDLARNFESSFSSTNPSTIAHKQNTWTNAIGGGMVIPLLKNKLEFSASGLYGKGGGRYGTSQLPDATFAVNGSLRPLTSTQLLTGLTWHITPLLDLWAYYGEEKVNGDTYKIGSTTYGYGNNVAASTYTIVNNANMFSPQVSKVAGESIGLWWNAFKGNFGAVQLGTQYSHISLDAFTTTNGDKPHTFDNMFYTSIRYFPFN